MEIDNKGVLRDRHGRELVNTPKEEEREPLLSDEEIDSIVRDASVKTQLGGMDLERWKGGAHWALRYVLNAKITSGELRVVKTTKEDSMGACVLCDTDIYIVTEKCGYAPDFCPGCGAQIVNSLTLDESSSKLSDVQRASEQMGGGA